MNKLLFLLILIVTQSIHSQQNITIGSGNFEGEPYLVINPTNTQNIVIAWMHKTISYKPIRTRTSFDGGLTWGNFIDLPIAYNKTADPTMAFDNSGNLYLCFIDHLGTTSTTNSGAIYSYKSTDGGLSWGNPAIVIEINADGQHQPIDRPWLVCDNSNGAHQGNLYVTTKTVSGGPSPFHPYFIRSTNGAISWDNWRYVDTTGWLSGVPSTFAAPTINMNGTFCAMYPSYVPVQSPTPKYIMAYSNDAGSSFNYKTAITNIPAASNDSAKRGWQLIADPLNENHIAFLYISGSNIDLDILMTETFDFGTTWSAPQRINDDPLGNGILQDLVWASFDEDSDLVICWRDRRNDGGSGYARSSEIIGAIRWKDSLNFSSNFIISDTLAPYSNILSQSGNDFLCQQVLQDTLYVTWGDTRSGFLNIWFNKIALNTGNSTGIKNINHCALPYLEVYPNPTSNSVSVSTKEKVKLIQLFNSKGNLIKTVKNTTFSIEELANGSYFMIIITVKNRYSKKLIKD